MHFLRKPENIARVRKYRGTITTLALTAFVSRSMFGMTSKAINMYTSDTLGINLKPEGGSQVAPHNRIDYLTHSTFHRHLLGEGLLRYHQRFSTALLGRTPSLKIQDAWTEFPDFMEFWLQPLTASMNEALTGNILECLIPNFNHDFLTFVHYSLDLMKGLPKWWIPEAYRLRESLTKDVNQWHATARAFVQGL